MAGPGNGNPACVWEARVGVVLWCFEHLWANPSLSFLSVVPPGKRTLKTVSDTCGWAPVARLSRVSWYAISVAYCAILKSYPGRESSVLLLKGLLTDV